MAAIQSPNAVERDGGPTVDRLRAATFAELWRTGRMPGHPSLMHYAYMHGAFPDPCGWAGPGRDDRGSAHGWMYPLL